MRNTEIDPLEPIKSARPPIQRIIKEVLRREKERLYEERPRLREDIVKIIKQEIRDDS